MTKDMGKKITWGLLSLAAVVMAGCQEDGYIDPNRGLVPIYLTATVSEGSGIAATRAGADVQSTQLANGATFAAELSGSDVTVATATYTADGTGGATTETQPYFTLTGSSTTVKAYHGKSGGTSGTQVTSTTTSFTVASDQSTDAAYRASDLMYASATVTKASPVGALTFTHRMAKIIVNATLGDGISSISAVKIIGGKPTVALSGTDCTIGAASETDFSKSSPLTVYSGTHSSGTLNCAALLPPQTVSGDFLLITTDQGDVTYNLDSKAFATAQSYTFNITVNALAVGTTVEITDWADNGNATVEPTAEGGSSPIPTISAHAPSGASAVDLGLSVKWANMNVGATTATDYGTYFSWGETIGYTVTGHSATAITPAPTKTTYNWETYWWGTSSTALTKYVPAAKASSYGKDGFYDDKTVLDLSDDAAYMNWGGNWRMPTQAECEELTNTDNCTWSWQSNYNSSGVAGYLVTSKKSGYTSNSIFLPAPGDRRDAAFYYQGSHGDYWSSTLDSVYPNSACVLDFGSHIVFVLSLGRSSCFTVRPVQSH